MFPSDYQEMLNELLKNDVEFVLVGAYAMSVFGYTRATGDIDFLVNQVEENIDRLWTALRNFGAPLTSIEKKSFMEPGIVFQIGIAPLRIDILTRIDGVAFKDINIEKRELYGTKVPVIDLESLIKNKKSTGRLKDLADCEELEKRLAE